MTKFTQKSFSVSCASGGVSDEELARRWEETFGKKKRQSKPPAEGEAPEEGPDEAPDDGLPSTKILAGKKA